MALPDLRRIRTESELRAAVEEAAKRGTFVAAHAHGAEGIKRAVRAGVRSIEHASYLDDEGIALMKQHGTWLVADVYNGDYGVDRSGTVVFEYGMGAFNASAIRWNRARCADP